MRIKFYTTLLLLVAIGLWTSPLRAQEDSPETAGDPAATEADTTALPEAQPEEALPPEPAPPTPAPPQAPPPEPEPASEPTTGTLKVVTRPAGATVTISDSKRGDGQVIGETPVEVPLKPWTYWVTVKRDRYDDYQERITLRAGMEKSLDLDLEFDSWTPLKITSAITFWTGIAAGIVGGGAGYLGWYYANQYDEELDDGVADQARLWTGVMYGAGGAAVALVTTGIICYFVNKKKEKAFLSTVGVLPTDEGGLLSVGRRF